MSDTETAIKKAKLETNKTENGGKTECAQKQKPEAKTCAYWVKRKKRFCKITVAKGREYCGEHVPAQADTVAEDANRITCPLDGKHTIYKSNLQKHLKICNARPKEDVPPYIEKGINAGESKEELEDYSKLRLSELADEEFFHVIEKVKTLHAKYVDQQIKTLQVQVQHKQLEEELAKEDYGKEARKHLLQTAALLGVLESAEQFQDTTSFIEFGAGKGQLAYYLAQLLQQHQLKDSQVVLLDRMSLRHKKDNRIEDRTLVHRIRADIADFRMLRLEILQKAPRIVAVSKHLCGAATDLTLRCITQPALSDDGACAAANTAYVLIALCCHHRCDWRTFVGKDFLRTQCVTPRQFAIITKMVGWAICGTGMSRERRRALEQQAISPQEVHDIKSAQRLPLPERERIGFMCKRLLDHARLEFLRQKGYEASLNYYVPQDVTLENVCLLARKV